MASEAMMGRLLVLSLAMQEIARALPTVQAASTATAITARLEALIEIQTEAVDEGIAAELAPLLAALCRTTASSQLS